MAKENKAGPTATEQEVINDLLIEKYDRKAVAVEAMFDPLYSKKTYLVTLEDEMVIQCALELKVYRVKNPPKKKENPANEQ